MTAEERNPFELAGYYVSAERPREALEALRGADPADVRIASDASRELKAPAAAGASQSATRSSFPP